jgi:hypothetical protein
VGGRRREEREGKEKGKAANPKIAQNLFVVLNEPWRN